MNKILLIFLHGYGANGADLKSLGPFFKDLADDVIIESPNAIKPMPDQAGGYQWFPIENMSEDYLKKSCHQVYPEVVKMVRALQSKHAVGHKETFLIGFSQGAMMALYSALAEHSLCRGVVGFSGGVYIDTPHINADKSLKISLVHGEDDEAVPATASVKSYDFIQGQGFSSDLALLEDLAHSIDVRGIQIAKGVIKNTLL